MTQDIERNIDLINASLDWAKEHDENFPADSFKDYRRRLKKIKLALEENCAAAAYGESQVGKSYLMSSLLSAPGNPFMIAGNSRQYSFIDEINPSGGANAQIESTGIVTRFTAREDIPDLPGFVRMKNFSVVDIVLMLVDAYYNDIIIDPDNSPDKDKINRELDDLAYIWQSKKYSQDLITEDDIKDIVDYARNVIGNNASAIYKSAFSRIIGPVIQFIPEDKWKDLFSVLWNRNPDFTKLFETLLEAYKKIKFTGEVFIPFDAVLREKGTILSVQWLDTIFESEAVPAHEIPVSDVFARDGKLLAKDMPKGLLSALIAEITFRVPDSLVEERPFLRDLDLLDFPGARSRESYKEKEISTVIPKILRRGKVAYLFNKYSRDRNIGSLLFCHHNHQKNEDRLGDTVTGWIETEIGKTPSERAVSIARTNGISPFFFIATKFNMDLEKEKTDSPSSPERLDKHWERFNTVIPEIFDPSPWLYEWYASSSGRTEPFRNIYPLRDFYWSAKRGLFQGYSDGAVKSPEISVSEYPDFPQYMESLRDSFLENNFVKQHFANPQQAWEDVATLNNDGSRPIIKSLSQVAAKLEEARKKLFLDEVLSIRDKIKDELERRYEPDDPESRNKKVKKAASAVKMDLTHLVGSNPMAFGKFIDRFMIAPEHIRNIAYEVIELQTERPRDFTKVNFIRACAEVDVNASREENINKLLDYFIVDSEKELQDLLLQQDMTLEEILSKGDPTLTTVADVVTKHVVDFWKENLDESAKALSSEMPHADIVADVVKRLFSRLNVSKIIAEKIGKYIEVFDTEGQPNVIGDYVSLTLNNFVSTVGRNFIKEEDLSSILDKARVCRINIDVSSEGAAMNHHRQPLIETLKRLDESVQIINNSKIDTDVLRHLPFWKNYERWQNFFLIGLVGASDISSVNGESNKRVFELIQTAASLYS